MLEGPTGMENWVMKPIAILFASKDKEVVENFLGVLERAAGPHEVQLPQIEKYFPTRTIIISLGCN